MGNLPRAVCLLFVAMPVAAADMSWRPVPIPWPEKETSREMMPPSIAADGGLAAFFFEWRGPAGEYKKITPAERTDIFMVVDLVSGKELLRLERGVPGYGVRAVSSDGLQYLVSDDHAGFGPEDQFAVWSRSGQVKPIPGPGDLYRSRGVDSVSLLVTGAGRDAFSADGQRLALRGQESCYQVHPGASGDPQVTSRAAIIILGATAKEWTWFVLPPDNVQIGARGWAYTWDKDETGLLVGIPQDEEWQSSGYQAGELSEEAWQRSSFVLYRVDIKSGTWQRLAQLPLTFGGFAGRTDVVVWKSNRHTAFARVPIKLLEDARADGEWWVRFSREATFETVVSPEDDGASLRVAELFLGDRRCYAFVLRRTTAKPSGVPEIWVRTEGTRFPATPGR